MSDMETFEKWSERTGKMDERDSYYITCCFLHAYHNFQTHYYQEPSIPNSKTKHTIPKVKEKEEVHPQVPQNDSHKGRSGTGTRLDWHDICIGLIQREKHVCCLLT